MTADLRGSCTWAVPLRAWGGEQSLFPELDSSAAAGTPQPYPGQSLHPTASGKLHVLQWSSDFVSWPLFIPKYQFRTPINASFLFSYWRSTKQIRMGRDTAPAITGDSEYFRTRETDVKSNDNTNNHEVWKRRTKSWGMMQWNQYSRGTVCYRGMNSLESPGFWECPEHG